MSVKKIVTSDGGVRWEATFYPHGRSGKKLRRRFEKKIDADKFLYDCKKQRLIGESVEGKALDEIMLEDEIKYWLEIKGPTFTEGYFRVIRPALKVIRNFCGDINLSKINLNFLHRFRQKLRDDNLSVSTQNRYLEVLTRIISFSFNEGRIQKNPVLKFKSLRESKDGIAFWSDEEVTTFLNFASKKYSNEKPDHWIFVAYFIALETGVRARELWGMQLRDLDLERNSIRIVRQYLGCGKFSETKGKESRIVPVSNALKEEIIKLAEGRSDLEATLFLTTTPSPVHHDTFSRTFQKDLKESGVRPIRFHDLRHTALTLLVKQNISPWAVQRIAGHKDMRTTLRYVHIVGKDIEAIGANRVFGFGEVR